MFALHLGVTTAPVYCTKIASKLARTYTDRHGLKDVTRELLAIDISKAQQSSDWGNAKLSEDQIAYAASDVLNLHALRTKLDTWAADFVVWAVGRYGNELTAVITQTIERWDGKEAARKIELHVGRDLQFIRINGTVVGGLVGVVIHAVSLVL